MTYFLFKNLCYEELTVFHPRKYLGDREMSIHYSGIVLVLSTSTVD
jgi:hypothetical protein